MSLTENGNDILEGLVVLEDLLDATGDAVVLIADDVGVHDTGGGVEGIDGGVDTQLGDGSERWNNIQLWMWPKLSLIFSGIAHLHSVHKNECIELK